MRLKPVKILLFVSFLFPLQSMSWGVLGHRIVGEIADSHLNARARAAVKSILGDESIAMAANWADFIKSDSSLQYLDPWHYIDFDAGLTYTQLQEVLKSDTATDAYTRLTFLTNELKKRTFRGIKRFST